mmetsp:Transcript_20418/g.52742  ORF Transcript_20418/g.52742 Transcript_20418/m.52742 type:complete len:411 (-) Transcript_20418:101-1333(-)
MTLLETLDFGGSGPCNSGAHLVSFQWSSSCGHCRRAAWCTQRCVMSDGYRRGRCHIASLTYTRDSVSRLRRADAHHVPLLDGALVPRARPGVSAYAKPCRLCGESRTCAACVACSTCSACTRSAMCACCRGMHFRVRRAAGVTMHTPERASRRRQQLQPVAGGGQDRRCSCCLARAVAWRSTTASSPWRHPQSGAVRAGLSRPSHTAATRTLIGRSVTHCCELGSACAGRWSFDPSAGDVRVEDVDGKEQYETPAWIWKYWIHRERLDFDAHATALSAVLPSYSTAAAPVEPPACARIWLNPAYGRRCGGIGGALCHYVHRHVRERGCTLVALVPVLSHTDWCATSTSTGAQHLAWCGRGNGGRQLPRAVLVVITTAAAVRPGAPQRSPRPPLTAQTTAVVMNLYVYTIL